MNPERWEQIQAILAEAEACPPQERAALLDRLCQGDVGVRDEVESLLAASSEAVGYFEGLAERAITPFDDVTGSRSARSLVGRQARSVSSRSSARAGWARSIARPTRSSAGPGLRHRQGGSSRHRSGIEVDAARRLASVRFAADPGFRVSGTETLFTIPPGFDLVRWRPSTTWPPTTSAS